MAPTQHSPRWLQTCYDEVSSKNGHCEEFLASVAERLGHRVRGELDNEHKQQALFYLLGEDYVSVHFPYHKYNPSLLDPPRTKPEVREGYLREMRHFLDEELNVVKRELGYPEDVATYSGETDLGEFLDEVRHVFKKELDHEVGKAKEGQLAEKDAKEATGSTLSIKDAAEKQGSSSRSRSSSQGSRHDSKSRSRSRSKSNSRNQYDSDDNEEEMQKPLSYLSAYHASNVPGTGLVTVSKKHSAMALNVTALQRFRQAHLMLPPELRKYLWEISIYEKYAAKSLASDKHAKAKARKAKTKMKPKPPDINRIRADFRSEISIKQTSSNLQRAVKSTDAKKILNVSMDIYHTSKVLQPIAVQRFIMQGVHVINVLNVRNKSYSIAHIMLLIPLQLVYPRNIGQGEKIDQAVTRLACDLDVLVKSVHLKWPDVFDVVQTALQSLDSEDPKYKRHLDKSLAKNVHAMGVHDFAAEILDKDTVKSKRLWNSLYDKGKKNFKQKDLEPFAKLALYLRKWVSEAFVGVLGQPEILFVWDILFMHGWTKDIFVQITLALLFLIKPWAIRADAHRTMSRVLLEEPSKIYIGDLRRALRHISEEEPLTEIVNSNFITAAADADPANAAQADQDKALEESEAGNETKDEDLDNADQEDPNESKAGEDDDKANQDDNKDDNDDPKDDRDEDGNPKADRDDDSNPKDDQADDKDSKAGQDDDKGEEAPDKGEKTKHKKKAPSYKLADLAKHKKKQHQKNKESSSSLRIAVLLVL